MTRNRYRIEKGNLLLATPFMDEGHFKQSVILVCEHSSEEGTLGFVINKKLDLPLNDLLAGFPEIDAEVYFGGPVATDTIHYIHTLGEILPGSIEISEGLWWGGDFEQLQTQVALGMVDESQVQFLVGYSGWSAGQLDGEMDEKTWVLSDMKRDYFLHENLAALWHECMAEKGGAYSILSEMTPDKVVLS